ALLLSALGLLAMTVVAPKILETSEQARIIPAAYLVRVKRIQTLFFSVAILLFVLGVLIPRQFGGPVSASLVGMFDWLTTLPFPYSASNWAGFVVGSVFTLVGAVKLAVLPGILLRRGRKPATIASL